MHATGYSQTISSYLITFNCKQPTFYFLWTTILIFHILALPAATSSATPRSLSYEDFCKRKAIDRVSTLPTAGKKCKSTKSKTNSPDKVKIQVGIKEFHETDHALKILKGRSLPVSVKPNSNAKQLLEEATDKHAKHYRSFNQYDHYVLLYPDNTIIDKIPGSLEDFTLERYKEELGKPYSKISLYICRKECLEKVDLESDCDSIDDAVLEKSYLEKNSSIDKSAITRPIRPFCTIVDTKPNSAEVISLIENDEKGTSEAKAKCPMCYLDFPTSEIEYHADICSEQFDFVGTVEDQSETIDDDVLVVDEKNDVHNVDDANGNLIWIEKIKDVISCANKMVDAEAVNRVSIRRRFVFKYYIAAREKLRQRKRFNPKGQLKLTFIGEPAVDDGGPRREFFSGRVSHSFQDLLKDSKNNTKFNFIYLVIKFSNIEFFTFRSTR